MLTQNFAFPIGGGDVISGVLEATSDMLFDYKQYCKLSYIQNLLRNSTILPRYRLFICNADGSYRYQIPYEDIATGGSYSENYQNGRRRSLSFSLINNDGKYTPGINSMWANSIVGLETGLEIPSGIGIIWFKKGVYVVTNANPSREGANKTVSIECADKWDVLEGKRGTFTQTVEVPVGTLIEDCINDTLTTAGGDGYPIDSLPIIYHSSFKGRKTPLTISVSSNSNIANLITQLAEILSAEVFYNAEGRLTFVPIVETMSDGDKPVLFDYVDTLGDFQNENFSFDMSSFVNKVVVVGANVNGHTVTAEAVNNNPDSPISYQKIGYRIGQIINDSNITNDILAQERADYELRKVAIAQVSMSSSVFFNPCLTVNNIVTFTDGFYLLKRIRVLIQSISFSLDYQGVVSLTAANINDLPFVV